MEGALVAVALVVLPVLVLAATIWAMRERRLRRNGRTLLDELEDWRNSR